MGRVDAPTHAGVAQPGFDARDAGRIQIQTARDGRHRDKADEFVERPSRQRQRKQLQRERDQRMRVLRRIIRQRVRQITRIARCNAAEHGIDARRVIGDVRRHDRDVARR